MAAFGADVIRINGNYEASLAACKEDAAAHGWQIVSDTSWPGYTEVPLTVMAGYGGRADCPALAGGRVRPRQDDLGGISHVRLHA